ncbi:MAG: NfeD family protein [Candidatus Firestonebacteria bacterium]
MAISTLLILSFLFVCFLTVLGVKALRGKAVSGSESLIGEIGKVKKALEPEGIVFVSREDYTARSKNDVTIEVGEKVKVVSLDGNKVIVEKMQ